MVLSRHTSYFTLVSFNLILQMSGDFDISSTAWQYEDVKEIHNRRYQLQERALEIFLLNGKTYFVAFQSSKVQY